MYLTITLLKKQTNKQRQKKKKKTYSFPCSQIISFIYVYYGGTVITEHEDGETSLSSCCHTLENQQIPHLACFMCLVMAFSVRSKHLNCMWYRIKTDLLFVVVVSFPCFKKATVGLVIWSHNFNRAGQFLLKAWDFRFYSNTYFLALDHSYICKAYSAAAFLLMLVIFWAWVIIVDTWSELLVHCRKPEQPCESVSKNKPRKILVMDIRTPWGRT